MTIEDAPEEPAPSSSKLPRQYFHADEADSRSRAQEEHHSEQELHHSKQDDEDWETASEGEEEDGDHRNESHHGTSPIPQESFEDALTEDEQKQRALSQANVAKAEGNGFYAAGKYEEALECYIKALEIVPELDSSKELRAICHSNSATCHFQLNRYEEAVEQSTKALEINSDYAKAFMRRAQSQEKLDHLDEALTDYNKVLELSPGNQQARVSARKLEPIVAERREKLKDEMIGKLKDLGNTVLGKFGMSVDNFKAVKDPNTGSYSISFQR